MTCPLNKLSMPHLLFFFLFVIACSTKELLDPLLRDSISNCANIAASVQKKAPLHYLHLERFVDGATPLAFCCCLLAFFLCSLSFFIIPIYFNISICSKLLFLSQVRYILSIYIYILLLSSLCPFPLLVFFPSFLPPQTNPHPSSHPPFSDCCNLVLSSTNSKDVMAPNP